MKPDPVLSAPAPQSSSDAPLLRTSNLAKDVAELWDRLNTDTLALTVTQKVTQRAPANADVDKLLEIRRRQDRWCQTNNMRALSHVAKIVGNDGNAGHGQWVVDWCAGMAGVHTTIMKLQAVGRGTYYYSCLKTRVRFFEALAGWVVTACAAADYRDAAQPFVKKILGGIQTVYGRCRLDEQGLAFVWVSQYMRNCLRSHDARGEFSAPWIVRLADDVRHSAAGHRARRLVVRGLSEADAVAEVVAYEPGQWARTGNAEFTTLKAAHAALAEQAADALMALCALRKEFVTGPAAERTRRGDLAQKAMRALESTWKADGFDASRAVRSCAFFAPNTGDKEVALAANKLYAKARAYRNG